MVLQKNAFEAPIGIEIKSDVAPSVKDVSSLYYLQKENPAAKLYVLCRCKEPYQDEGINFLPFQMGIERVFE